MKTEKIEKVLEELDNIIKEIKKQEGLTLAELIDLKEMKYDLELQIETINKIIQSNKEEGKLMIEYFVNVEVKGVFIVEADSREEAKEKMEDYLDKLYFGGLDIEAYDITSKIKKVEQRQEGTE